MNLPVVLERTPYNKAVFAATAEYWTARGYVFAVQDVRGRFRSEGIFEPFMNEGRDGFDTIEWLASQAWCSGKIGTIGASYDAWVQWQAAIEQPPHLAAMVVRVSPTDPDLNAPFEHGVFLLAGNALWLNTIRRQRASDASPLVAYEGLKPAKLLKILQGLPVSELDLKLFGGPDPIWRKWTSEAPPAAYWTPARILDKLDRVKVPVLHQSGWFDDDGVGTKLNYLGMVKTGAKNQRLIIGPWEHTSTGRKAQGLDFGPSADLDLFGEYSKWFDHWLKGTERLTGDPVKLFVMGENKWISTSSYPPPTAQAGRYFLTQDGGLVISGPSDSRREYTYDPANPTWSPRAFGDSVNEQYGKMISRRKDMITYRSIPFESDLRVVGPMSAKLTLDADTPETDVFVRLSIEDARGRNLILAEGRSRVQFQGAPVHVEVDLWHTAARISRGERLVLNIASASFPMFARNVNTGANSLTARTSRKARVAVIGSTALPSFVDLLVER